MAVSTDRGFGSKLGWIATFIAIWGAGAFAIDSALGAAGVDVMPAWALVSWTFLVLGFTKGVLGPFRGAPNLAEAPTRRMPAPPASPGAPANWYPDPSGQHEHRYWDGLRWTAHVATGGVQAISPVPDA